MADRQASSAAITDPDVNGNVGLPDGEQADAVVARAEHEAAIAEERKRRGNAERKYQQTVDKLQKELEDLKTRLAPQRDAVPLPELPENDPVTKHLQHLYQNQREWQDWITTRERTTEQTRRMSEALQEAVSQGVPEEEIDTTSFETIRASVKDYLSIKTITDLQKTVKALEEQVKKAPTIVRDANGQLRVSTATGPGAPGEPEMDAHRQLALVREEKAEYTRKGDGAGVIAANRAERLLQRYIDITGGKTAIPPGWQPPATVR